MKRQNGLVTPIKDEAEVENESGNKGGLIRSKIFSMYESVIEHRKERAVAKSLIESIQT